MSNDDELIPSHPPWWVLLLGLLVCCGWLALGVQIGQYFWPMKPVTQPAAYTADVVGATTKPYLTGNHIDTNPGALRITFSDRSQFPTVPWTLSALAPGSGRISDVYDTGIEGPTRWRMTCQVQLTGTNVIGEHIKYWLVPSVHGSAGDRSWAWIVWPSCIDAEWRAVGTLDVYQTTTNTTMTTTFFDVVAPERRFALAVWNATSLPFTTDSQAHGCTLTAMD